MIKTFTKLFAMAMVASIAISPNVTKAGNGPPPKIVSIFPDETGGVWVRAEDGKGRTFTRFCRPGLPERCTPFTAVDIAWKERISEGAAVTATTTPLRFDD